jgi:hypothetical protein
VHRFVAITQLPRPGTSLARPTTQSSGPSQAVRCVPQHLVLTHPNPDVVIHSNDERSTRIGEIVQMLHVHADRANAACGRKCCMCTHLHAASIRMHVVGYKCLCPCVRANGCEFLATGLLSSCFSPATLSDKTVWRVCCRAIGGRR